MAGAALAGDDHRIGTFGVSYCPSNRYPPTTVPGAAAPQCSTWSRDRSRYQHVLAPQLPGAGDPEENRPMVDTACACWAIRVARRAIWDEARVPQRLVGL